MDIARDKETLEIISAEDLWYMENVESDRYICVGCSIKAIPCSYRKFINKKRPYFRFDELHDDGCFIQKEIELAKSGKVKSIVKQEGFPMAYPNKLDLETETKRISKTDSIANYPKDQYRYEDKYSKCHSSSHNYTVKTIFPIVRRFLQFPYGRHNMALNIPGIEGNTYQDIIKSLPYEIVIFLKKKLRYGVLNRYRFRSHDKVLPLKNGDWINKKPQKTYEVIIETTSWKDSKVKYIVKMIETAYQEAIEKQKDLYVFFIGEQDKQAPHKFIVTDHRLIACTLNE